MFWITEHYTSHEYSRLDSHSIRAVGFITYQTATHQSKWWRARTFSCFQSLFLSVCFFLSKAIFVCRSTLKLFVGRKKKWLPISFVVTLYYCMTVRWKETRWSGFNYFKLDKISELNETFISWADITTWVCNSTIWYISFQKVLREWTSSQTWNALGPIYLLSLLYLSGQSNRVLIHTCFSLVFSLSTHLNL